MKQNIILLFSILISCYQTDCEHLPASYKSYDEATSLIRKANFTLSEKINTPKSSWIRSVEFYSCDGKTGYFILVTDSEDYLFQGMPKEVWEGFKNAESFGSYYNAHIKGNYNFEIDSP